MGTFLANGPPFLLPGIARGLGLLPATDGVGTDPGTWELVVAGPDGVFQVPLPHVDALADHPSSWEAAVPVSSNGTATLPAELVLTSSTAAPLGSAGFAPLTAAFAGRSGGDATSATSAASQVDFSTGSAAEVSVVNEGASVDFGIYLCSTGVSASVLHVLGQVDLPQTISTDVVALHASPAGPESCGGALEPVLWAASRSGQLAAIGLSSGSLLATFAAPLGASADGSTLAALAGNSSHLVAVVDVKRHSPVVFSTPCPVLPKNADVEL